MKIATISVSFLALLSFITTLSVWNHNQGKEIARLKETIANVNVIVDLQNKQIIQDKLDLESYKKKAKEAKAQIITRYVNTSTEDKECQAQLDSIQKALQIFYTRKRE